jgi:hypothetical protein
MHPRRIGAALVLAAACGLATAGTSAAHVASQRALARPPAGYRLVASQGFTAVNDTRSHGEVTCPSGLVPLGGSAMMQSASPFVGINQSFPLANGWVIEVTNNSGVDFTFEVLAFCAKPPKHYLLVRGPATPVIGGTQATAFATCPPGSQPLGGGGASGSPSVLANLNATAPNGASWGATLNNGSPSDTTIEAWAVCGKVAGYTVVAGSQVLSQPGTVTPSLASCPGVSVPISGGAISNASTVRDVNLGPILPVGNSMESFMNNGSVDDFMASTVAVCAG